MNSGKGKPLWRFEWYIVVIFAALAAVVVLAIFTNILKKTEPVQIPQIIWLLITFVFLLSLILMLSKTFEALNELRNGNVKLEKTMASLEKIRAELGQVNQNIRISETAKGIAFRDADRHALRDFIFDKLQQQDFKAVYEIIDEIASQAEHKQFAEQLRIEVESYRDASGREQENQLIAQVENLIENHEWVRASVQIERLIKAVPFSAKTKAMRQKLLDKKEERKRILLNAWDDAVKRRATDRSLEILRELDLYLTPNEGLALQEAARDVFKNKLHNLGAQFSMAISGKQWDKTIEIGQQIIRDFPNSRISGEIRKKMDTLKQKVTQEKN